MEELYCGIDLHSTNNQVCLINSEDKVIKNIKLKNDLLVILYHLEKYKSCIVQIAIESTFNWYWLVDGLKDAGYDVRLVNTAASQQYNGLKYVDDKTDARWLANMLRLRILPEGYIYPKEERGLRDLLRKRSQLVRMKTANILSVQNLIARNSGKMITGNDFLKMKTSDFKALIPFAEQRMAIKGNLAVIKTLESQIKILENSVLKKAKLKPEFEKLTSIDGVGKILAMTIMLETGEIKRFSKVGNFVSYARCVSTKKTSNGKKKGEGNRKNGNKYLSWAFVEGANFLIRFNEQAKKYYEKKRRKTKNVVAIKAIAHKLARASYFIMRDKTEFEASKLFA